MAGVQNTQSWRHGRTLWDLPRSYKLICTILAAWHKIRPQNLVLRIMAATQGLSRARQDISYYLGGMAGNDRIAEMLQADLQNLGGMAGNYWPC